MMHFNQELTSIRKQPDTVNRPTHQHIQKKETNLLFMSDSAEAELMVKCEPAEDERRRRGGIKTSLSCEDTTPEDSRGR